MPTFAQVDGVSKEIKKIWSDIDGTENEFKNLNAEVDGVFKEIFASDIFDKIKDFYLLIDYVGYYPVDSDNAFGSQKWIYNTTDLEESDWDNNVGDILVSKDGTQLIARSPIKYGSGKAKIQASLCARLKDGTRIRVNEANGFELDKLSIQTQIKCALISIVTGTQSRSCSRSLVAGYATEPYTDGSMITNVFSDSTSCSVNKTVEMTPITQGISYNYFILTTYGSVVGTDSKSYYYLAFTMLNATYKDRLFDIGNIGYFSDRMKIRNVSVSLSDIEEIDVVLSSYSSATMSYRLSSGASGTVMLIKSGNFTTINQLSNHAQVSVSDSTLTLNPYYGVGPCLYFFVYVKMSNGKHVHISRLSNHQQSCINIPFTFYKRTVSDTTSGSTLDSIGGRTRDKALGLKYVSYNLYTGSDLTEHSWSINVNGCQDDTLEYEASTGFKPTTNYDIQGGYFSYGLGASNSSVSAYPATPAAYLRWILGNTTIESNNETRTVPTKFIVQEEPLNVGY